MPDIGNEEFDDKKFFVVTKEWIYIPRALPTVEHEIAHAVEMKDQKRWLLPDWGLAVEPFNRDESKLTARMMFAAMSREIRVRAIELVMLDPKERNDKSSTRYNILNNQHAWGEWTKRFTPFGRFKSVKEVEDWVHTMREQTLKAWSLERVEHEWKIRFNHMRNYMDTRAKDDNGTRRLGTSRSSSQRHAHRQTKGSRGAREAVGRG